MPTRNLEPGQFQIGDTIMGEFTMYKVESLDIGNYDVNVQDSQAQSSSTIDFGIDTFKPAPIQMTINLLVNKMLPNVAAAVNSTKVLNFDNDPNLDRLQEEWRAEETLMEWGEMKPLYFCGTDGITRQFFGRPGKFSYRKARIINDVYYVITAEFRRADTYAYSEQEWFVPFLNVATPQTISLNRGSAPSPVRILIFGPANHPVITWGTKTLSLDWDIPAGKVAEITSYPWLGRRVVDSDGLSLAAYLTISNEPYLDRLKLYHRSEIDISWNAVGTTADSKMIVLWHDGYQVMA